MLSLSPSSIDVNSPNTFFASYRFQIQPDALILVIRIKALILMIESRKKLVKNKHKEHTRFYSGLSESYV